MQTATIAPRGLKIIAILTLLVGIASAFVGLALSLSVPRILPHMPIDELMTQDMPAYLSKDTIGFFLEALSITIMIFGIMYMIVSYGIRKKTAWAWKVTVIVLIAGIGFGIIWYGLRLGSLEIIGGIILFYMFRPRVRAYFAKTTREVMCMPKEWERRDMPKETKRILDNERWEDWKRSREIDGQPYNLPEDEFHFDRGRQLFYCGRYEEALRCFDKALEICGRGYFYLIEKGRTLLRLGRYKAALSCFDKASEGGHRGPYSYFAWRYKGYTLALLGNIEEAMSCLDKVKEMEPRTGDPLELKELIRKQHDSPEDHQKFVDYISEWI